MPVKPDYDAVKHESKPAGQAFQALLPKRGPAVLLPLGYPFPRPSRARGAGSAVAALKMPVTLW